MILQKAIAILIWIMIYPMMMKINFQSIKNVGKHPLGIIISSGSSWLIKPFLMFGLASLFIQIVFKAFIPAQLAQSFVTGAVLLGTAPCTVMVFVWSNLAHGDPAHTLVQVSVNDLLILVLFVPLVSFLLGINNVQIPWATLVFSIILFVVVPLFVSFVQMRLSIKLYEQICISLSSAEEDLTDLIYFHLPERYRKYTIQALVY